MALSGATTATFGNRAPGSGERLRLHYVSLYRSAPRGVHCSYWARRACVLFSLRRLSVVIVVFVFFFFFFFFLPSFASRLVVVTVFSRRQPSLAEPRCSSVSNNHDIRACGKSTCWLPLNESERARARTPLCHRRDVQLNHAVRASVLPHQDHSSGREITGSPSEKPQQISTASILGYPKCFRSENSEGTVVSRGFPLGIATYLRGGALSRRD